MARYPTLEEYWEDPWLGIGRCDELLAKRPHDVQLLVTKLQLLYEARSYDVKGTDSADEILDRLLNLSVPVTDANALVTIGDAVSEAERKSFPPPPPTAIQAVSKLWDRAVKATSNVSQKLDLLSVRFARAVITNHLTDAQQSLIQLKALQPKNRAFFLAHAAVTQLLATSSDDLPSRLALSLARKAVTERFDDDKQLDCRVPGQIFAIQGSEKDLESIKGRSFSESKQVYDAIKTLSQAETNGEPKLPIEVEAANVTPREWLAVEVAKLKVEFHAVVQANVSSQAVEVFAANAVRLFCTASTKLQLERYRPTSDACFLAISALVKAWTTHGRVANILQASYLAETLLRLNPQVHEAKLILVYLYMRLGLGTLALSHWDSLSIKEIQFDTVGHAMVRQLSATISPLTKTTSTKYSKLIEKLLTGGGGMYDRCEHRLGETEASVLSHGQTGMLFDLHDLRQHLQASFTKRIFCLEQRRMARLQGVKLPKDLIQLYPRTTATWIDTTDNRDFDATFNYGLNVERALHDYPNPTLCVLHQLAANTVWCLVNDYPVPARDLKTLVQEIRQTSSVAADVATEGLSAAFLVGEVVSQMLELLVDQSSQSEQSDNIAGDLRVIDSRLQRLNIPSLVSAPDALCERIQDHYMYCDSLRITVAFCKFIREHTRPAPRAELNALQSQTERLFAQLQKHARGKAAVPFGQNVRECVTGQEEMWEAMRPIGEQHLKAFCKSVADSAKEGWEGLTKIKLT